MSNLTYKGITYTSEREMCDKLNIDYSIFKKRLKRGKSLEVAIETPIQDNSLTYLGTTYSSLRDLCNQRGLNYATIAARIKRDGVPLEEAINKPLTNTITVNGVEYSSIKDLCIKQNLNYTVISNRINRDKMAIEDAIAKPILVNKNEVTHDGITYTSLKELCTKQNLDYKTISRRMSNGLSLEEAINTPDQDNSVTHDGITYPSIRALCTALNLNHGTIISRINRDGLTLDQAIDKSNPDNSITYEGITYVSKRDMCAKLNVNYDVFRTRTSKGMSIKEAIETPIQDNSLTYNGVTYASTAEISRKFDIPLSTLQMRLSSYNWPLEKAIETPVREASKSVVCRGITYASKTELARAYNISIETLNGRLRKGLSIEDAVDIPVDKANNFITPDTDIIKEAKALNISDKDRRVIFDTWASFTTRCLNPNNENFSRYGGRGISVYPEWVKSPDNPDASSKFLLWVVSPNGIGLRPEGTHLSGFTLYSIDRINNDGNYEPGNLRWSTSKEQTNNSTNVTPVTVDGKNYSSLKEASKDLGMNYSTAVNRHNSSFGLTSSPVKVVKKEEVTYLGTTYPNLKFLCSKLNVSYPLVFERVTYGGWALKDAIEVRSGDYLEMRRRGVTNTRTKPNSSNSDMIKNMFVDVVADEVKPTKDKPTYMSPANGEINVAAEARRLGVARSTISDKVYKKGMSVEAAVASTKYIEKIEFNGKVYSNFKEACLDLGKPYSTGLKHITKGYTAVQFLSGESSAIEKPTYEIDGMTFSNHRKLVRFYGYERGYTAAKNKGEVTDDTIVDWVENTREIIDYRGLRFVSRRVCTKVKDFLSDYATARANRTFQYLAVKNDSEIVARLGLSFGGLLHLGVSLEDSSKLGQMLSKLYDTSEDVSDYFKVKSLKFSSNLFKFEYSELISVELGDNLTFCIVLNSELVSDSSEAEEK